MNCLIFPFFLAEATMDSMDPAVLRYGTSILQAGTLLKLISLLVSFLASGPIQPVHLRATCEKYHKQIQKWWKRRDADGRNERELDEIRCAWTRRIWRVVFVLSMYRLTLRQVSSRYNADVESYDLSNFLAATLGLLWFSVPGLINPRSQDVLYVATMLSADAAFLLQLPEVDVRTVISHTFAARFVYAVLAKRIGCVVFCFLVHLLQAIQMGISQADPPGVAYSPGALIPMFLLMFVGIVAVRGLVRENVILKMDLQKRVVELGAVSSLLTACYDAVVEVDQNLCLTQHSRQLSSMLLQISPKAGGLSGKSLLDFFAEGDRARISEQVLSSISSDSENISVVAMNADMLDSDFNHVIVELFRAQFNNLASERCFLVGLREIQDVEHLKPCAPAQGHDREDLEGKEGHEDLLAVYDVYTLDLHIMNPALQQLCRPYLGDTIPDSILDLASHDSRLWLDQQLQNLANAFAAQASDASKHNSPVCVTFDFLGRSEAKAFVTFEHDQVLEAWVASMDIHLEPSRLPHFSHANLTKSNLQTLHSLAVQDSLAAQVAQVGHALQRLPRRQQSHLSRSSRSSRSQASSGRSGSKSGFGSPHSKTGKSVGAISNLRMDHDDCHDVIITKLPL